MQQAGLSILEDITDGIAIYDQEWRFLFVNHQGAEIFNQPKETLIGKVVWECYPEANGARLYQMFAQAMADQVSIGFQDFYVPLNRWFEIHAYPTPNQLIVLYRDITQHKQTEGSLRRTCGELEARVQQRTVEIDQLSNQLKLQTTQRHLAEEALRATNDQLASVLESITDAFLAVDTKWQFTYINHRAEQVLQKNQSELLGRNLQDIAPQILGSGFYYQCLAAVQSGMTTQFETFCPPLRRWFQSNIYPSAQGASIYLQDITNRKQVEAAYQQLLTREQQARTQAELAEHRCTFLAEAGAIFASSLDYETTLTQIADSAVPFLADYCLIYKLEDSGQIRQVAAAHHQPEQQVLLNQIGNCTPISLQTPDSLQAEVLRTGEPILVSHDAAGPNYPYQDFQWLAELPALRPRSIIVAPLSARGYIFGVIAFVMSEPQRRHEPIDRTLAITFAQRAAMAIDNAQLYLKAQQLNRLKDEFLSTLSHELRSPLNAILGWAQLLQKQNLDEQTVRQALATIERKAKAQVQLIYDLLDMSQIITGGLRLNPAWVELDFIIQTAVDALTLAAEAKSIQVEVQVEPGMVPIRGDAKYLHQVVWNLLANAIKFSAHQGQIKVQLARVDHQIQIRIQDTGQGISADFLPYVFDHFRQADSSITRPHEGLGLGLSLVRHLVELHGGTVHAESVGLGQGSTFVVKLPIPASAT